MDGLSPEFELVRLCAVVTPHPDAVARIRSLAQRELEWDVVVEHAMAHATLPLLHRNLSVACPNEVPGLWREELAEHYRENAETNATLEASLAAILRRMSERCIEAIPFKGPVLAATAYGDLTLREHGDLDILVAPENYRQAAALLTDTGMTRVSDLGWQASFANPDDRVVVDLHRSLSEPRFPLRLSFEKLWSRRRAVPLADDRGWSFSPEDALLVSCFQLVKDGWDRRAQLSKVLDVGQMQRAWPQLDLAVVMERAASLGIERVLFVALLLAHRAVDGPSPPMDTLGSSDRRAVDEVQERVFEDLVRRKDLVPSRRYGQRRFHARVRERVRDKVYPYGYVPHYARTYLKPMLDTTSQDRALVDLPRGLTFLYPLVRAYRVGKKRLRAAPDASVKVRRAQGVRPEYGDDAATLVDEDGRPFVTLNPVGALVWETLSEPRTIDELVERMLPHLEGVGPQQLRVDVAGFVGSLRDLGLVVDGTVDAVSTTA